MIFAFIFGAIFGSFLAATSERIVKEESILWPPSHCPHCQKRLKPWELIPIISFLALKGRCRDCKEPIGGSLLFAEIFIGLLAVGLYARFGLGWELFFNSIFISLLFVIAEVDRQSFWIPDFLSLTGLGCGLFFSFFRPIGPTAAFWGAAVGLPLFLLHLIYPEGMGGGDGKLLGLIGAFVGWQGALVSLFLGSLFGSVMGLVLMALGKLKRGEPLPFGPFLVLGAISWLFFGHSLWQLIFY